MRNLEHHCVEHHCVYHIVISCVYANIPPPCPRNSHLDTVENSAMQGEMGADTETSPGFTYLVFDDMDE